MNRSGLILNVIADIRSLADSLQVLAADMLESESDATVAEPEATVKEPEKTEEPKTPTLEDVRHVLAEKSRNGHTTEIKQLLIKHGADKLSDVNPAEYKALLAEVEVLGNAG